MSEAPPLLELREATVQLLKADGVVLAVIPEPSIYGERVPKDHAWPFLRYGEPDGLVDISLPLHVFSKGGFTDECYTITQTVGTALDSRIVELESGAKASFILRNIRVIPDAAEADAWHGIATFGVRIERDCDEP